jgi:uncharacterized protein YkwD
MRRVLALAVGLTCALAAPVLAGNEASDDDFGQRMARAAPVVRVAMPVACPIPAQATGLRDGMLQAVNARRRAAGMAPLNHNPALIQAAAVIACDNARRGQMTHTALVEGDLSRRLNSVGYRFGMAAEALAYGYSAPERLAQAWYVSPMHYPTLMTAAARETGIAVVHAPDGRLWWAMISARPR